MIEKKQHNIREIKASTIYIPKKSSGKFAFCGSFNTRKIFYTSYNAIIHFDLRHRSDSTDILFFMIGEQIRRARTIFLETLSHIKYIKVYLKHTTLDDSPRVMTTERYIDLSDFKDIAYDAKIDEYTAFRFFLKNDALCCAIPAYDIKNVLVKLYVGVID